jgi:lysophospholipase L1-like esterase
MLPARTQGICLLVIGLLAPVFAQEPPKPTWKYSPELLRPFWRGEVVEGESVLFIKDEQTGEARASVLFPIRELLAVRNSVGDVTYENGKDFVWKPESREIVLPAGSRVPSRTPRELRRPAKTQKYELTHRDGNGEIFFGARLEYAEMQTCITYRHALDLWKSAVPKFDPKMLPRSVARLVNRQPLSIVTLGDSISAGANASALFDAVPYQPAYPELVRRHLAERFRGQVEMKNLAVGGTDTGWGLTQIDKVVEVQPNLVILAFGMNDSAGRSPQSYLENSKDMITRIRERLPECEFILVASMLGNRDWVRLKHEAFPQYRDALQELVEPGVALADLTSIWTGFLELKPDWDQTGNGVNHPNDFGHRVYAQAVTTLLDPRGEPDANLESAKMIEAGPLKLSEQRLLGNYTYSYACAAFDLDGDGDLDKDGRLDIVACAERGANELRWWRNSGRAK